MDGAIGAYEPDGSAAVVGGAVIGTRDVDGSVVVRQFAVGASSRAQAPNTNAARRVTMRPEVRATRPISHPVARPASPTTLTRCMELQGLKTDQQHADQ
jgi:hypothetical protein